jgi:hypothetical protein
MKPILIWREKNGTRLILVQSPNENENPVSFLFAKITKKVAA